MRATSEELLELVSRSPEAVAIHDKQAWLELFSRSAVVQDPVGTAPHRRMASNTGVALGGDPLGRFWETFIAPNQISFASHQDIVIGEEVVRDVSIRSQLGSGITVDVPVYLIYRTTEEHGEARIESLMAHWELRSMVRQVMAEGLAGLSTMFQLGWRMLRIQGASGVLGYMRGSFRGIFGRGGRAVRDFAAALNARDEKTLVGLLDGEETLIEYPAGVGEPLHEFLSGAGRDLRIDVSGLTSAGWWSSCVFQASRGDVTHRGVAFFEFSPKSRKIRSARFFWNA
jgi:hypothetical protein